MADGFKIGDGYVEIHRRIDEASARKAERDIERSGESAGKGFEKRLSAAVSRSSFPRVAGDLGQRAGELAGERFTRGLDGRIRDSRGNLLQSGAVLGDAVLDSFGRVLGRIGPEATQIVGDGLLATAPKAVSAMGGVGAVAGGALLGAIVPAVTLAGAAAGGALVAGMGGALVYVVARNAAAAEEVGDSWRGVADRFDRDMDAMSVPFERVMVTWAGSADRAWTSISGTISRATASVVPKVEMFGVRTADAVSRIEPAIQPVVRAFGAVLDDLGPRLPGVVDGIADSLIGLSSSIERNPEALGDMVEAVGNLLEVGVDFLAWCNDAWSAMKRLQSVQTGGFQELGEVIAGTAEFLTLGLIPGLSDTTTKISGTAQASAEAGGALQRMADATRGQEIAVRALNGELERNYLLQQQLSGTSLSYREAQEGLTVATRNRAQAEKAYADAVRDHGPASAEAVAADEKRVAAGFQVERSERALITAARERAMATSTATTEEGKKADGDRAAALATLNLAAATTGKLTPSMYESIAAMDRTTLAAIGVTREVDETGRAVYRLPNGKEVVLTGQNADAMNKIDGVNKAELRGKNVIVTADVSSALGNIGAVQAAINNLSGAISRANAEAQAVKAFKHDGGRMPRFHDGGRMPGTGPRRSFARGGATPALPGLPPVVRVGETGAEDIYATRRGYVATAIQTRRTDDAVARIARNVARASSPPAAVPQTATAAPVTVHVTVPGINGLGTADLAWLAERVGRIVSRNLVGGRA